MNGKDLQPTVPQVGKGKPVMFCDGSMCGTAGGWAWILYDADGDWLAEEYGTITNSTNNVSEYQAAVEAARYLADHGITGAVIHADSQLVVMQANGQYQCKAAHLKRYWRELRSQLKRVGADICWIRREDNEQADALARYAAGG